MKRLMVLCTVLGMVAFAPAVPSKAKACMSCQVQPDPHTEMQATIWAQQVGDCADCYFSDDNGDVYWDPECCEEAMWYHCEDYCNGQGTYAIWANINSCDEDDPVTENVRCRCLGETPQQVMIQSLTKIGK